jgi:hypothetical protein
MPLCTKEDHPTNAPSRVLCLGTSRPRRHHRQPALGTTVTEALHYLSAQVPPLYQVPLVLSHPEDPPVVGPSEQPADAGAKVLPLRGRRPAGRPSTPRR